MATAPERRWPKLRLAIVIGALLLLAVPAGAGLYFWTRPASVDELRAQLAAATAGYQCAALNYAVNPDRTAVLSGHVASETDLQRLRHEVDGIRGFAGTPGFGVWLMIWPYCEADAVLTPVLAQPSRDAPRITLASKTDEARIGDCLMLDVIAPGFDSYIYVDYFAADGNVLHLLPNRWDVFNLKPPRNHFTLGRPAQAPDCWRLGGATGEQLITLIAAKKPLFADGRHDTENARDYLASLSDVMKATAQGDSAASLLFFNLRQ